MILLAGRKKLKQKKAQWKTCPLPHVEGIYQNNRGDIMTKHEELMAEYDNLYIEERQMINDGLYADGCIWINKDMPTSKKLAVLAEEIGHYETSVGNILDQDDINNRKQELTARKWAYKKVLPRAAIETAFETGHTELWDIAEYLDIDEAFLREALKYYEILDV